MCLIIAKPKNKKITKQKIESMMRDNPHGAGVAWIDKTKKLRVEKGFFDAHDFYKFLKNIDECDCLIHARYATSGKIDKDTCHPFFVSQKIAVAHNGIFSNYNNSDLFSDTQIVLENILKPNSGRERNLDYQVFLKSFCGTSNKLCFLDAQGFVIINKNLGQEIDGIWYSQPQFFDTKNVFKYQKFWNDWVDKKDKTKKTGSKKYTWCSYCNQLTERDNNFCEHCFTPRFID